MAKFRYTQETKASAAKVQQREELYKLFAQRPLPDDQLLTCLVLHMRSSALAKVLFINELYELIQNIPGVIMEFGTWWGQNLVLFENLRAIYEPFNQNRRIIGFDSFRGYVNVSSRDKLSDTIKMGGYTVSKNYKKYIEQLIDFHERNNVLGNIKKHEVVEGDVTVTVPKYLEKNSQTIIALAYFDLAVYKPTKVCLEAIKPHLIRGSVVMFDELNSKDYPGETIAFKEVFKNQKFTLKKSKYMTDRAIAIMD